VLDETNGSQVEQVDLDELDDEEAPCVALRNMSIGDVCPKESEEPPHAQDQPSSSMQASPTTQDEDKAQEDEGEDQEDEPPQEESNDQGGDAHDQDKEDEQDPRPPHPRVHQAMQEELNNFKINEVWHLVPRPNQNVVGTKWVFRNKQDEHGVVTRNKARLMAKGYS
jgi:hypothetical protein